MPLFKQEILGQPFMDLTNKHTVYSSERILFCHCEVNNRHFYNCTLIKYVLINLLNKLQLC